MTNRTRLLSCILLTASCVSTAAAQDRSAIVIENRIASYREIGAAYKYIADELKSRQPRLPKIRESAQLIKARGADMLLWFPPGSGPSPADSRSLLDKILGWLSSDSSSLPLNEPETHARSAIWTQRRQFELEHRKFKAEADRMWQASQSGQIDILSAQFKRLGKSCKSCHDTFRSRID